MENDLGRWLGGIAMGALALLGLLIMSRAATRCSASSVS